MKANHSKLWLTLSLLLTMGCGARTPLDDWETNQPASPSAGGATSQSGGASASLGGSLATGGQGDGGSRGGQVATGGTGVQVATGGTGGQVATSGTGGQVATGGRGGTVPLGGTVVGGRTGRTGGTIPPGGTIVGGRGGSGGTPPLGGTVVGGRTRGTGGATSPGGTIVGGRGGSGGTVPFGGTAVGGRGGTAGSSAAGGTGAVGSGGTAGTMSCPLSFSPSETPIDDMNDGDRLIPQVDGRSGAWSDSSVGATGSTMFPDPAGPFTMTPTGDGCPGYSAYVRGGPFVDQGVFFSFGLGSPYNASAYTGFSFWAKIDSGTSPGLRVAFPDKDTQPDGALCQPAVPGSNFCYDHYGKRLILTTGWTKYTIYFNSVTQDGWGRQGAAFDPSTIYGVQFQMSVNATFAIWIDDVAFTGYFGPTP